MLTYRTSRPNALRRSFASLATDVGDNEPTIGSLERSSAEASLRVSPFTKRITFCACPPLATFACPVRATTTRNRVMLSVYMVGRDVACDISGQTLCYGWDSLLGWG